MSLPWFRLYSRMVDNDKLKLLAFEDRWHFVALCCLKSDGLLDEPESDLRTRRIAVKLGVQVRELDEIARRLREVDLIDETLNPVAWDELQYKSDNSSQRVKRFREKRSNTKAKRGETLRKRFSNALETDTDTDTEVLEPKGSCASPDAPKPEHVVEKWNEIAGSLGKPKVRDLTPERRQLIKARLAQYTLEDFVTVFTKIGTSPFLRGDTGWRGCTFDWIFKKANFQKTLEGNYDD